MWESFCFWRLSRCFSSVQTCLFCWMIDVWIEMYEVAPHCCRANTDSFDLWPPGAMTPYDPRLCYLLDVFLGVYGLIITGMFIREKVGPLERLRSPSFTRSSRRFFFWLSFFFLFINSYHSSSGASRSRRTTTSTAWVKNTKNPPWWRWISVNSCALKIGSLYLKPGNAFEAWQRKPLLLGNKKWPYSQMPRVKYGFDFLSRGRKRYFLC